MSKKKFFVKEDDGIYVVQEKFFDDIESREEALIIALRTYGEIHITLKEELENNSPLYIENMKVITGLQRCLDELDKRYPYLLIELHAVSRRINGYRLFLC